MSRPAPRKSSLAGANPITPPAAQHPALETATPATTTPASESVAQASEAASKVPAQTQRPAKVARPKVSFYQDADDTKRVRGALLHTMTTEGSRNLSEFINRAVMAEVERLEAKYNNGNPFPPVGSGELPQGRPMGR